MKNPRLLALYLAIVCAIAIGMLAQHDGTFAQGPSGGAAIRADALREWLTYISSDALEGRNTFSEGLGLAGAYIAERLKEAGVKGGGDAGTYFQRVRVLTVRSTSRSSVVVEVNGQTRTFRDGEGVSFPDDVGLKRTLTLDDVEFVGYGLNLGAGRNDYEGRDIKGKAVIWLGNRGPRMPDQRQLRPVLFNRDSLATEELGAAVGIGPALESGRNRSGAGGEFTTTQRLDVPKAPAITASDEFFEFLFSGSPVKYSELKAKSEQQDSLPGFRLEGVKMTFHLDADYRVTNTRYTRNVIGIVEGSDAQLKAAYVAFGAHYDHIGYMDDEVTTGTADRIFNGADDDGSGTSALIAIARAFALGPKPKRSLIFIWHAGEEHGLWGSAYFADHPQVPLESIVAQLNMDMIGRNRGDRDSESNNVLAVGSDRISTELHNVMIDANASMARPLRIDFEMNDPTDPEQIYYRSDHYSYAAKGIPVIFFFAGLHPDYHRVSDEVDKINFDKVTRVAQLVYETGRRVADLDHVLVRDFKGPRLGKGASGKIDTN
jgi:hypothetical protein